MLDTRHQLIPLHRRELTGFDLLARELTDVADKTVDQLEIRHLKREDRHGCVVVDGHALGH